MLLGLIAGFMGGIVDSIIMRIMDGFLSFPFVLLSIILMTVLGQGLINVIIAIGIGNIPSFARVVRGEVHIVKMKNTAMPVVLSAFPTQDCCLHIFFRMLFLRLLYMQH